MTFKVISEANKTCQVGIGGWDNPAISRDTEGSLTIPNQANGYIVTMISNCAFDYCNKITAVVFPGSLEIIGSYAFYDCTNFIFSSFPDNLTHIGFDQKSYC